MKVLKQAYASNHNGTRQRVFSRLLTAVLLFCFLPVTAMGTEAAMNDLIVFTQVEGTMCDSLQLENGDFIQVLYGDERNEKDDHKLIRAKEDGEIVWIILLNEYSDINRPSELYKMENGDIAVLCIGEGSKECVLVFTVDGESIGDLPLPENTISGILCADGCIVSVSDSLEDDGETATIEYRLISWDGSDAWSFASDEYNGHIVDCLTDDGGFLLSSYSATENGYYHEGALFKVDRNGSLLWEYTFEPTDGFQPCYFKSIDVSDGYLCLGWYSLGSKNDMGKYRGMATLLDEGGNEIWHRIYDCNYSLQLTNGEETDDGYDIIYEVQDNEENWVVYNGMAALDKDGNLGDYKSTLIGDGSLFLVKTFGGNEYYWCMGNIVEFIDDVRGANMSFVVPVTDLETMDNIVIELLE